jgi:hypothetical protein
VKEKREKYVESFPFSIFLLNYFVREREKKSFFATEKSVDKEKICSFSHQRNELKKVEKASVLKKGK